MSLGLPAGEPGFLEGRDVVAVLWLGEMVLTESLDELLHPGLRFCAGFDLRDVVIFDV